MVSALDARLDVGDRMLWASLPYCNELPGHTQKLVYGALQKSRTGEVSGGCWPPITLRAHGADFLCKARLRIILLRPRISWHLTSPIGSF
jgi:hypothetical protein